MLRNKHILFALFLLKETLKNQNMVNLYTRQVTLN
jgi:hypothetical protein